MDLALRTSTPAVNSVLVKLGSLLAEEYALIRGVRGDIQFINDELTSMQAFLSHLGDGDTDGHDDQTEDWIKQVRDVSYDIEDCVDDVTHRIRPDRHGNGCWDKIHRWMCHVFTWYPRRSVATKIAELKQRAHDVGKRRGRYGVPNPKPREIKKADFGRYRVAEHQGTTPRLVGIEKPVGGRVHKELEEWIISDENKQLGVLSIYGFGGVGKTTAAKALYRTCGVHFKRRAMITVSHNTDPDVVLRDILEQLKIDQQGPNISEDPPKPSWFQCLTWSRKPEGDMRASIKEHQDDGEHGQLKTVPVKNHQGENTTESTPEKKVVTQSGQNTTESTPEKKKVTQSGQNTTESTPEKKKVRQSSKWKLGKDDGASNKEQQALTNQLIEQLQNNRYLLLIDDVWSASTWHTILKCLPKHDDGSRIIVTTRFEAVANSSLVDHHRFHQMDILDDKEAKKLFDKSLSEYRVTQVSQANGDDQVPNRVWEICGGLPLPILTMAGVVASSKYPNKEWTEVCNSLFPKAEKCRKPEDFMRIINYCYSVLPSELKTCSLYLTIFPKGSKISRKRLIRRWISEGIVSEKHGLSLEDVADTCFSQLVERNIIRPVEHSSNGNVKSCQVHDMVLEFIISKSNEENFVTVLGGQWSMTSHSSKIRRLSVHRNEFKHAKRLDSMKLSHVRSLTVFGSLDHLRFKSFKTGIVQVLDLQGCAGVKENSVSVWDICEMTLLKYLSLRGTNINHLPEDIKKLKYLETLDIRETKIKELPDTVVHLERIRNILGGDKRTRKTLKLPKELKGAMKELRILSGVEIVKGSTAASDLGYLNRLTKLAIYKLHDNSQMFTDLLSSVQYLSGYALQNLVIDDGSSHFLNTLDTMASPPVYLSALELSGKLLKLPNWLPKLDKLVKLSLSATALNTDNLVVLSNLASLFSLTFSISVANQDPGVPAIVVQNASLTGEIYVPPGGFDKLKLLRIFIPTLPALNFSRNATPQLERLELSFQRLGYVHGVDKLSKLNDVNLTIDGKADEPTKSTLDDFRKMSSTSKYALIISGYHE